MVKYENLRQNSKRSKIFRLDVGFESTEKVSIFVQNFNIWTKIYFDLHFAHLITTILDFWPKSRFRKDKVIEPKKRPFSVSQPIIINYFTMFWIESINPYYVFMARSFYVRKQSLQTFLKFCQKIQNNFELNLISIVKRHYGFWKRALKNKSKQSGKNFTSEFICYNLITKILTTYFWFHFKEKF